MALRVLTAPATTLLTTLDRVKAELKITDTSSDVVLLDILGRASGAIATECGRPFFGVGTYVETQKGSGSQLLPLTCVPVLSVAQVLQDTELLPQVDPLNPNDQNQTDGYSLDDPTAGALYRSGGWGQTVALLSWGWEAYGSRYILPGGTNTLRYSVTYTAGYLLPGEQLLEAPGLGRDALYDATDPTDAPPLPGEIEQACLLTVKAWWYERDRDYTVLSAQADEVRVAFAPAETHVLPVRALGLLRNHRRIN